MIRHPIIDGREVAGNAGPRVVYNPFDGAEIGQVTYADRDQMCSAVGAAHEAFRKFRKTPAHERMRILRRTSEAIGSKAQEIARTISLESGKPINYARGEVERAVFTFSSAAEAASHAGEGNVLDMSVAPSGAHRSGMYRYFPLGVIAAITPFNFPLNLVAHKVAPAIAAGNAVVLKPAPQTPLTSFLLGDILREAGLPDGVLNVVPCENDVAEQLVQDERVSMISFTGSAPVGWKIKSIAGQARVVLELGGNGAVIVDEIADQASLIKTLTTAAFNYAGQVCISLQTLFVRRPFYQTVLSDLIASARSAHVGDPLEASTLVGPMISERSARKVEGWIADAVSRGATRHTGEYRQPNWITPTVLTDVSHETTLYREEAFAPLVIVEPYDELGNVIRIMNESKYGLQAGLFSTNVNTIQRAYEELEVGALIVNDSNSFRLDTMPYGGVKSSGLGREGLMFAMREMSELKLLVTKHE